MQNRMKNYYEGFVLSSFSCIAPIEQATSNFTALCKPPTMIMVKYLPSALRAIFMVSIRLNEE